MPVYEIGDEQELLTKGIATRYYKDGVRYQAYIRNNDRLQSLGIFHTLGEAAAQRETYVATVRQIMEPFQDSTALKYFKALDRGEEWTEPDEAY